MTDDQDSIDWFITHGKELLQEYRRLKKKIDDQVLLHMKMFSEYLHDNAAKRLNQGKLTAALTLFTLLLEFTQALGNREDEGGTLNNIGLVYRNLGRLQEALDHYREALAISREVGDRQGESFALNNLGAVYRVLGQPKEALKHFEQAFDILRDLGDRQSEGGTLNHIGIAYQALGRLQEALDHYREALAISREVGDRAGEGLALQNIGTTYATLGRLQEALDHYREALAISREVGDRQLEGSTLHTIGVIYESLGKHQEALSYYEQARDILREVEDRRGEGAALGNIGRIYQLLGQSQKALEHLQQALVIFREIGFPRGESDSLGNIGWAYWSLERYGDGLEALEKAVDIAELLVGGMASTRLRQDFRATHTYPITAAVALLFDWYRAGGKGVEQPTELLMKAVKFLELGKAREIVDRLEPGQPRQSLLTICPEMRQVIEEEQRLTDRLQELDHIYAAKVQAIAALRTRGGDTTEVEELSTITKAELEQVAEQLKAKRRQILDRCADPGQVRQTATYNPLPSFRELFNQSLKVLIWEFFYAPESAADHFQVLAWSEEGIVLHQSNSFDLSSALKVLKEFYVAMEVKDFSGANNHLLKLARLMGGWLPEGLWQTLTGKELLVLVPHGQLHLFPWGVAQQPSTTSAASSEFGGFLGLTIPMVRSYSLSLVVSCLRREKPMPSRVLFVANPNNNIASLALEGADKEVDSILDQVIGSLSPKPDILGPLRHSKATEDQFIAKAAEAPSIIHFAGHGAFAEDPWMSHLKFYAPKGHSPHTVTEMLDHRFPGSPLFVLSACETSRSEISRGDEALGILRGLTLAGATTIIATNWLLDDQVAPHLMRYFYEAFLGEGLTVAEALFRARRELYEDRRVFEQPQFWAVYTLYGNPFKRVKS